MAGSSLSLSSVLTTLSNKLLVPHSNELTRPAAVSLCNPIACSRETNVNDGSNCKRRLLLLGIGGLTSNLFPASPLFAEEVPKNYRAFVDSEDGYSYYYPSDWIDFDFLGHDSAFKDRYRQLQNVRVRFIPTDKKDIHDLGPMEEVIYNVVTHRYTAPNQRANILDMQERTVDGKNYYTVEFALTSPNFACNSFATIAIGNGRYYTLIVGANERRWKKFRNMLKVIADSFKMLDI
ncbi:PsbP-like protein 2 [Tripterygium wilfordii]|uniref:PsbP-like protein 2 n=1 Tax=Tripterygium wilfordii TaxID=458696 RepID=A0A7J7D8J6_TRIWF|nr:photosynthetic NDH subunit of lumenal location 1, chloroplastic isoform X1 [Tripterygium wilfordii]KAF5742652.1 PsbP-like protein 2 [Tripterygium wilfordii]